VLVRHQEPEQPDLLGAAPETTVDDDLARVGADQTGADLQKRRLAGAVGPHDRHNFAGVDDQIDVGEHPASAVRLGDAARLQPYGPLG